MILIVIPARSGSKGIKNKNLRKLNNKSLLNNTIDFCHSLSFDKFILVSTDSKSYMNHALKSKCELWPLRAKKYSDDKSLALDVWRYEWLRFENYLGKEIKTSIYLEPTSPFRKPDDVYECLENLKDNQDCCFTCSEVPQEYSPYKMIKIGHDFKCTPLIPNSINEKNTNRQSLPKVYQKNGLCYAASRERVVIQRKIIYKEKTKSLITKRKVVNIDTIEQLKLARKMLKNNLK